MAIFGTLQDLAPLFKKTEELEYLYLQVQSLFKQEFLSKIQSLKEGENFKTPLEYEMFFITHCYSLKEGEKGFFESHQKYIDLQIVIEGFERYLIGDHSKFDEIAPYDAEKDLQVHSPKAKLNNLFLQAQEMCILFPEDIHGVGIGENDEIGKLVKKAIFKIPHTLIKHRL